MLRVIRRFIVDHVHCVTIVLCVVSVRRRTVLLFRERRTPNPRGVSPRADACFFECSAVERRNLVAFLWSSLYSSTL